ncbi:P-loop NTPase fold protein [Lentzea sp. NPDC003310]|uniref:P-loop NTPase fold protein n=1 Tax=Lentzea sp. NPDC003310 TaxID=3154447 RepID=UPI0033BD918E
MSSAEPPSRMTLERVIQLGMPVTDLAVSARTAEGPLIQVNSSLYLYADTGVLFDGDAYMTFLRGYTRALEVQLSGVTARATGGTVTLSNGLSLNVHKRPITTLGVCDSRGGPMLISASEGGSIRLWDVRTGEQRRVGLQQSPTTSVVTYAGPDGSPRIVAGGPENALYIWNPQLAAGPRIGRVTTRGFNDRVAAQDLLDRSALVAALANVLEPGEGPTVITVEGAWGSGKSTVLEFVRAALAAEAGPTTRGSRLTVFAADRMLYRPPVREIEKAPKRTARDRKSADKPLVASFNPWRHQSSEQVWAGLAKTVIAAAESALTPDLNAKERYWFANNARRVDRRHLQRQLWKRIYSPLLSFAGLGFGVSLVGALTKLNVTWAWWVSAGIAALGVLHTARRYFFGRASAFLPGELFAGPVTSNAFAVAGTDPLIRDPYYNARSGHLYLVQHDVKAVLDDLAGRGYQLVLLIDDLDRCVPSTTAQVFEAVNVFLSDDFPATRFVLGLDSSVVASHVDHAYKELADAKAVAHPDDPSPGWTFLRKLVQLPVRLPRTTEDNVDQVLLAQLGPVHHEEPAVEPSDFTFSHQTLHDHLAEAEEDEQVVVAIERHPLVRDHLRRRLMAQPEQSVREEKRLLNVWQFYLRVLASADVDQACHLVVVAEIAVRWPAYLHRLRGAWVDLADAVGDDVEWGATIARLGYGYGDRGAAANLRKLLQDCNARAVAGLADRLF